MDTYFEWNNLRNGAFSQRSVFAVLNLGGEGMVCEMDKTSICTEINSFEFWKEQCGLTTEAYDMSEKMFHVPLD